MFCLRKAASHCPCAQKIWQNGQKMLLRRKKKPVNIHISRLFTADTEESQCNSRYPHRLASVRCGQNVQVSPFSEAPTKIIVLGNVEVTDKSVSTFSLHMADRSLPPLSRRCSTRVCCPSYLLQILLEIKFFNRLVPRGLHPFP
jgi:hypothetical protein